MVLNGNFVYRGLNHISKQYAVNNQSFPVPPVERPLPVPNETVASLMFKSLYLEHLQINAVRDNLEVCNKAGEEKLEVRKNPRSILSNSAEKYPV